MDILMESDVEEFEKILSEVSKGKSKHEDLAESKGSNTPRQDWSPLIKTMRDIRNEPIRANYSVDNLIRFSHNASSDYPKAVSGEQAKMNEELLAELKCKKAGLVRLQIIKLVALGGETQITIGNKLGLTAGRIANIKQEIKIILRHFFDDYSNKKPEDMIRDFYGKHSDEIDNLLLTE